VVPGAARDADRSGDRASVGVTARRTATLVSYQTDS
jgi:hypothetical protein